MSFRTATIAFLVALAFGGLAADRCASDERRRVPIVVDLPNPVDVRSYSSFEKAVAAIGTSERTLLIPNTQSVAVDVIVPTNVSLRFLKGGSLEISSSKNVIINGSLDAPIDRIFSTTGRITFGAGKIDKIYPQWWGADNNEFSTEDRTAIEAAIGAAPAGGTVFFPGGSQFYKIDDRITVDKSITLSGAGPSSQIRQTTATKGALLLTGSDVTVTRLAIHGPQSVDNNSNENGIYAAGSDADNYIANLSIRDCVISNFGDYAIRAEFVEDFDITNNTIDTIWFAGIGMLSCRWGEVIRNGISHIDSGAGNFSNYGITATRSGGYDLATKPRCQGIVISKNTIRGVSGKSGLDTHGGEGISFVDNRLHDCRYGINIGPSLGAAALEYAPSFCSAVGNSVDAGALSGGAQNGLIVVGAFDGVLRQKAFHNKLIANTVIGYGTDTSSHANAVYIDDSQNTIVANNVIVESSRNGIYLCHENYDFSITGNIITDSWSESSQARGIYINGGENNRGYIGANTFAKDSKIAANVMTWAIYIDDQAGIEIVLGKNRSEADNYLYDPGGHSQ